jgi:hypothetical protein
MTSFAADALGEDHAVEFDAVVEQLRTAHGWADHITGDRLLRSWAQFVEGVERGYDFGIEEYSNDLDVRRLLDDVLAASSPNLRAALEAWAKPLDALFYAATFEADAGSPSSASPDPSWRWHRRVPRHPGDDLFDDLASLGLVKASPRPSDSRLPQRYASSVWLAGNADDVARIGTWVTAAGYDMAGIVDPTQPASAPGSDDSIVVAVRRGRSELCQKLAASGWYFEPIIHPTAEIDPHVSCEQVGVIGPQSRVREAASLWAHVFVGADVTIGERAVIEGSVVIEDGVMIGNDARICAGSVIRRGASIPPETVIAPRSLV